MGWVKIDREITNHWLWEDRPFSKGQAWIDLILLANKEDKKILRGDEVIQCKRGDVNLSILELSVRWGWSRHKVRDFMNALKSDMMADIKRTPHGCSITLVNYSFFQSPSEKKDSKRTHERTAQGHNQEIKDFNPLREREIDKEKETPPAKQAFVPPTLAEVEAYAAARNSPVDPQTFWEFFDAGDWVDSKGVPVQNWKQKFITWERAERNHKNFGTAKPRDIFEEIWKS